MKRVANFILFLAAYLGFALFCDKVLDLQKASMFFAGFVFAVIAMEIAL